MGFQTVPITRKEAEDNFFEVVDYCRLKRYGYSEWKGVLIAADHLASALEGRLDLFSKKLFIQPDLSYYHSRKSELYPLSLISVDDERKHTLVTAPTGAGKTDFLIRRCKGRVFYTLPFQASINAMYERIKGDLKNTDADVRLLHEWQLKYYLFVFEKNGIIGVTGILEYPVLRKTENVLLSDIDREEIRSMETEIKIIIESEQCPPLEKKRICKNCSYYDFCYSREEEE